MSKVYNYQITRFLMSAPDIYHLPIDNSIEIAFIGRSNAGKSSTINILTNQKNLARTSKIPGSTQLINLFEVKPGIRLVDLPGYGYAQVQKKLQFKLQYTISEYLKKRNNLKGLVMLIDIRHPMQNLDEKIIQWALNVNMPILVLLTKADKLSLSMSQTRLIQLRKIMIPLEDKIQIELFSSIKKIGLNKLRQTLDTWFSNI